MDDTSEIAAHPADAGLHIALGDALLNAGRPGDAEPLFARAVEPMPVTGRRRSVWVPRCFSGATSKVRWGGGRPPGSSTRPTSRCANKSGWSSILSGFIRRSTWTGRRSSCVSRAICGRSRQVDIDTTRSV